MVFHWKLMTEVVVCTYGGWAVNNVRDFWGMFGILGQILRFLVKITCFLSFSSKNHAESSGNFVKNLILNPKRAKLNQKS